MNKLVFGAILIASVVSMTGCAVTRQDDPIRNALAICGVGLRQEDQAKIEAILEQSKEKTSGHIGGSAKQEVETYLKSIPGADYQKYTKCMNDRLPLAFNRNLAKDTVACERYFQDRESTGTIKVVNAVYSGSGNPYELDVIISYRPYSIFGRSENNRAKCTFNTGELEGASWIN